MAIVATLAAPLPFDFYCLLVCLLVCIGQTNKFGVILIEKIYMQKTFLKRNAGFGMTS